MGFLIAILTLLLIGLVVALVSAPLRRARELDRAIPQDDGERPDVDDSPLAPDSRLREDLEAAREAKYREIRDAELDFRTGKLSSDDYQAIDADLRAEAIEILNQLEGGAAQDQGCVSSISALMKNSTAKKIVQRLRLRSTSEPPPSGPVPLPTPKAPERPESLPECIRIRSTVTTAIATSRTERIVSTPHRVSPVGSRRYGQWLR